MGNNFIIPLNSMPNMIDHKINQPANKPAGNTQPFQDFFQNAINNVQTSNKEVQKIGTELALGQSDALHQATIAATQAEIALKYLVQIRNKGHDAYSEIMRMGV